MRFNLHEKPGNTLCLTLLGDLTASQPKSKEGLAPSMNLSVMGEALVSQLETILGSRPVDTLTFETGDMTKWDSRVAAFVMQIHATAGAAGIGVDATGLPKGMQSLIALAQATPARAEKVDITPTAGFFELMGMGTLSLLDSLKGTGRFLAEAMQSFGRFFRGKAQYQRSDVSLLMQLSGPQALPIIGVVNILLGVILAFMGSVQLRQFGAEIFVADLVALGQTRDIAPMMTAIVMAGRTGAAYAAQLGTMQVNEETDALITFGFSPMDFLVLPRMLALAIMMPLLILYADAIGVFGGYLIAVTLLDLGTVEYIEQTRLAIDLGDIALGLVKGSVFGVLVAIAGCMRGMQSGRSASAVGDAATSAVVSGIIAIIVMMAVFAFITNMLGI